jgi:hypothetical protein
MICPKADMPEFTNNQYFYGKEADRVVYIEKGKDYNRRKK